MSEKNQTFIPKLVGKNLKSAIVLLRNVIDLLEAHRIDYHLEGGTLLGCVRENRLLPWDHDVDLSMMAKDAEKFYHIRHALLKKGYKVAVKKFKNVIPPLRTGDYRNFKIKPIVMSIGKELFPSLRKYYVTLDIFIKYNDEKFTYWQEKKRIMRLDRKYVESLETITSMGRTFKVPGHYEEYLTAVYGDWSVPVKEWDVNVDSKSIFSAIA